MNRLKFELTHIYRSIKSSAWLGWQIESNWTDPLLFGIYSFAKPVASALILVFMYLVVSRTPTSSPFFAYMYVGNAFYLFVGNILLGISWVIMEDREFFEMLKYVYTSPIRLYLYLFGRGLAKLTITAMAIIITLTFGMLFLKLSLHLARVDWGLLLLALVIGLWGIISLGLILAAISMNIPRHAGYINEGVAGLFILLSGAIFPIEVLPGWLQPVSKSLPFTYWLEAIRRAVLPEQYPFSPALQHPLSPTLASFSTGNILFILVATTLALAVLSHYTFIFCETTARRRGVIDRTTSY